MSQNRLLKRVLMEFKDHRWALGIILVLTMSQVVFAIQIPVLIGRAINEVVGPNQVNFGNLWKVLAQMAGFLTVSTMIQIINPRLFNRLVLTVSSRLHQALIQKVHALPLSYLDTMSTGNLVNNLVSDVEVLSDGLLLVFNQFFVGILTILMMIVTMGRLDLWMMLMVVALTPLSLVFARFVSIRSYLRYQDQSQARSMQVQAIEESIQQVDILRAYGGQGPQIDHYQNLNDDYAKKSLSAIFISSITNPTTRFINAIIYASLTYMGALRIINGSFTVGELATFLNFASQYTKPFNDITSVLSEIQAGLASAGRIYALLDQDIIAEQDRVTLDLSEVKGAITFENLSFSYQKDQPLMSDFNLKVQAGQKIAIVGPTGAGKSTLINLLMRFYDLNEGVIRLDGQDIGSYDRNSYRQAFGMVLQETWLKVGTVHDNIAYKFPQASRDQVVQAAKAAHAHHFIQQLPQGYDTYLADAGASLSIGQQQLLSIARLFVDLPKLLILDEATSSIDTRTEVLIQSAFNKLMQGRTSFIIAHRLSTIQSADMILVLDKGAIVEQGNHDQLMEARGLYYRMQMSRDQGSQEED